MAQTPFIETEALLAVMEDDQERAKQLLQGMLPGELLTFFDQVWQLKELIHEVRGES